MCPSVYKILFLSKRWGGINPLPDMPILGSSSSAAIKDMMSKIWEKMGIQLSDLLENFVGKGKIACY